MAVLNYVLDIILKCDSNERLIYDGKGYYKENLHDTVFISNKRISIIGSRSNNISANMVLYNTNSTLYQQILKSLSYCYLITGEKLIIEKILVSKNGHTEYEETDIIQPFSRPLIDNLKIPKNNLEILYSSNAKAQSLLNAIILYIKGIQEDSFDYYWKSFNSLYSTISTSSEEIKKLQDIRKLIENNPNCFADTLLLVDKDEWQDIRQLRLRDFILNNWPTQNTTTAYKDMIKRFTDYRICKVLEDTLPYRIDYLQNSGFEQEVKSHLQKYRAANTKDNTQLLCFYVLKYSYFLRNKYFHAEKTAPVFFLKKTSELSELSKINSIMQYFLRDLICCNQLYI